MPHSRMRLLKKSDLKFLKKIAQFYVYFVTIGILRGASHRKFHEKTNETPFKSSTFHNDEDIRCWGFKETLSLFSLEISDDFGPTVG